MRNFIFRNANAYDINLTIASLIALPDHPSVTECINKLIEFQFRGDAPDFLPDVQDTSRDLLLHFDYWLRMFGVEVPPDRSVSLASGSNSLDGSSLDVESDEELYDTDDELEIAAAATVFRRMLRDRHASPDTVMAFPGLEYTFHFDLDNNEEEMEEEAENFAQ